MNIDSRLFRVNEGKKVALRKKPTRHDPFYTSKADYRKTLDRYTKQLDALQRVHYANDRYSVLFILQAMDAAGKDGIIRHVFSGINPQGCQVFSFKHPSAIELDHDFLWRAVLCLPERGRIGVFNRSYYEDVLIVRVHPEILRSQAIPRKLLNEKTIWEERYRSILDMEAHVHRNGTKIVKLFLHISKEEQRKRFLARIDNPEKNWKFNTSDVTERACWDSYMKAYEQCLSATSTSDAPWYIVPADDKPNARLIVAQVILDTLKDLDLHYPKPTPEHLQELQTLRKQLLKEK
jgi:PPK2 family polyphosphate:nucleotide phosphotransferase